MWKLHVRGEGDPHNPLKYVDSEHGSAADALEKAYQLMFGISRPPHVKAFRIEAPAAGQDYDEDEIMKWCLAARPKPK